MIRTSALLLVLSLSVLTVPTRADTTWVFRGEVRPGGAPVLGYISHDGTPYGWGILLVDDTRLRLTGFGMWEEGWFLWRNPSWYFCLVFDPVAPWPVGWIWWTEARGVFEVFSFDGRRGEIALTVERVTE